jgi:hypothetical protein
VIVVELPVAVARSDRGSNWNHRNWKRRDWDGGDGGISQPCVRQRAVTHTVSERHCFRMFDQKGFQILIPMYRDKEYDSMVVTKTMILHTNNIMIRNIPVIHKINELGLKMISHTNNMSIKQTRFWIICKT